MISTPALVAIVAALSAAPSWHPHPRVVVDVQRVDGPHEADEVQREARAFLWGKIIKCYREGAANQPKLKGDAVFALRVSREGEVSAVRAKSATLKSQDVIACWARQIEQVPMPRAVAHSDVELQVHVAPGDRR